MNGTRLRRWSMCFLAAGVAAAFVVPARATVEEQRARLPPPAACDDPVAGVWKSHQYDPQYGDWYIFTLTIQRQPDDPNQLVGSVQAHSWNGTREEEEPPPCRAGLFHWTIRMTARGTIDPAGNIWFGGTSWTPEHTYCGGAPGPGQYNLDQFNGTIDPALQEFQSVNNDGGRAVNVPTVFRRISCEESPPAPHVNPVPPPFQPDPSGCSCRVAR